MKASPSWWLRPLYSRGAFSPRLLLVWQAFYASCFLAYKYVTAAPHVLNGVLVQPADVVGLVALFLGVATTGLGLGTLQKVSLDGPPAAPAQVVENAETVNQQSTP